MSALLEVAVVLVVAAAAARGAWSPCGLSMLSAVNPVAERGRGHRFGVTAAWFTAGAVAGGAVLGAVGAVLATLAQLVGLPPAGRAGIVALGAVAALAVDRGAVPALRLPLVPRQVDETWLGRYRRWVYASGYGVQLGLGVATYVMTAAVGLVVLAGVVMTPAGAFGLGLLFGLVRGLVLLVGAPVRGPASLARLLRALERSDAGALAAVDVLVALLAVTAGAAVHPAVGVAALAVAAVLAAGPVSLARLRRGAQPKATAAPGR